MDKNNTNFPSELHVHLQKALDTASLSEKLFYHQKLALSYVEMITNGKINGVKGLAIWHEMGLGKTILAIAIGFILMKNGYNVKILTPKSLQSNMKNGIKQYNKMMPDEPIDASKFHFLVKSHTILKQLKGETESLIDVFANDRNNVAFTKIEKKTVIIVDESHQISQLIANGSSAWIEFYETIMRSSNVIVIFLSGSLISSDPFELVPIMNMISRQRLFPEFGDEFMKLFWDGTKKEIMNRGIFQNRCFGMISRMKLSYLESDTANFFPKEEKVQIINCPMSGRQLDAYLYARNVELKETSFGAERMSRPNVKRFQSGDNMSSSYRVRSRQFSNFVPTSDILELYQKKNYDQEILEKAILDTPSEYFQTAKFKELIKILAKYKNKKGIIFSQFTGIGGAKSIAQGLIRSGWNEMSSKLDYKNDGQNFALVNGSLSIDEQSAIVNLWNDETNDHGEKLSVLIIGLQQAFGLDLQSTTFVIMYEPYWVWSVWEQLKKRINRYKSMERLPLEERVTHPYIMIATYPPNIDNKIKNGYGMRTTTDEHLYNLMLENKKKMDEFLVPLEEVAIECTFIKEKFNEHVCRICNPTNKSLYNYDEKNPIRALKYDCEICDPCNLSKKEQIKAQPIEFDGQKYYKVDDKNARFGYLLYEKIGNDFRELSVSEIAKLLEKK